MRNQKEFASGAEQHHDSPAFLSATTPFLCTQQSRQSRQSMLSTITWRIHRGWIQGRRQRGGLCLLPLHLPSVPESLHLPLLPLLFGSTHAFPLFLTLCVLLAIKNSHRFYAFPPFLMLCVLLAINSFHIFDAHDVCAWQLLVDDYTCWCTMTSFLGSCWWMTTLSNAQ